MSPASDAPITGNRSTRSLLLFTAENRLAVRTEAADFQEAASGFWFPRRSSVAAPLLSLNQLSQYPLLIYPEWETIISIYRKAVRGVSPGVADA